MKGIFYGVGVGPGDPELMTLKSVRIIMENDTIALPGIQAEQSTAYKIAIQSVPDLKNKNLIMLPIPMTKDPNEVLTAHKESVRIITEYLMKERNVIYLTLGDPNLYSSFSYLRDIISDMGYKTETISGVSSISACASRLNISLAQGNEPLHIYTSFDEINSYDGNIAVMKVGRSIQNIPDILKRKKIYAVEKCDMKGECIYKDALPEKAGYFSMIIAKDKE